LFVERRPAAAFHRCVVRCHRLYGNHAFDLVGRGECPQAGDRNEKLPGARLLSAIQN
jgi:hypothetical protein